jgi:hypothetical protein
MKKFFKHPTDLSWIDRREALRRRLDWAAVGRFYHLCEMYALSLKDEDEHVVLSHSADMLSSGLRCQRRKLDELLEVLAELGLAEYEVVDGKVLLDLTVMEGRCIQGTRPGERFFKHPANFLSQSHGAKLFDRYHFDGVGRFFALCEHLSTSNESATTLSLSRVKQILTLRGNNAAVFIGHLVDFDLAETAVFSDDGSEVTLEIPLAAPPAKKSGNENAPRASAKNKGTSGGKSKKKSQAFETSDEAWASIYRSIPESVRGQSKNLDRLYQRYRRLGSKRIAEAIDYVHKQPARKFWGYLFDAIKYGYAETEKRDDRHELVKKAARYVEDHSGYMEFCQKHGLDPLNTIDEINKHKLADQLALICLQAYVQGDEEVPSLDELRRQYQENLQQTQG